MTFPSHFSATQSMGRQGSWLPGREPLEPFFEKLIEKQVHHIALTIFEKIIDFCCRHFYIAYRLRLDYQFDAYSRREASVAQRVHYFMDRTPLFDRTQNWRAGIVCRPLIHLLTGREVSRVDYITIDRTVVRFSADPHLDVVFARDYNTKSVIIQNDPHHPSRIQIIEEERNGSTNIWAISTTEKTTLSYSFDDINLAIPLEASVEEVFLAYRYE